MIIDWDGDGDIDDYDIELNVALLVTTKRWMKIIIRRRIPNKIPAVYIRLSLLLAQ